MTYVIIIVKIFYFSNKSTLIFLTGFSVIETVLHLRVCRNGGLFMFLQVSKKVEYALMALLDIALRLYEMRTAGLRPDGIQQGHIRPGNVRSVSLRDIAEHYHIPTKYLEHIMLILKGAGFVQSKRGLGGGFTLIRDPGDITIGDIVRLFKGSAAPRPSLYNMDYSLGRAGQRAFHEMWEKVEQSISEVLDHTTFADIINRIRDLREMSSGYVYQI